jgi:hypothetical protein
VGGRKVVDLTWKPPTLARVRRRLQNRVVGTFPEEWAYRGITLTREEVVTHVRKTGYFASFIDDWQAGWPLLRQPRLTPWQDPASGDAPTPEGR